MEHPKLYIIKKVALAASIVIVLNLFVNFGVQTFYPAPKYENFCSERLGSVNYTERAECEAAGGLWSENYPKPVRAPRVPMTLEEYPEGWCNAYHTCQKEYETTRENYDRNVFIVLLLAGLLAFGLGSFIVSADAVSSGLIFGGVLSFIIGTMRYWSGMHDYLRFTILGLTLAALIWLGYTKLKK